MAYSAVPPPSQPDLLEEALARNEKQEVEKPAHVSEQQWKVYCSFCAIYNLLWSLDVLLLLNSDSNS